MPRELSGVLESEKLIYNKIITLKIYPPPTLDPPLLHISYDTSGSRDPIYIVKWVVSKRVTSKIK